MFRNILVPLDGSRFAEAALPYATRLASAARARLHLALSHEPVAALVGMGEALPPIDLEAEIKLREKSYLADTAGDLLQAGTTKVEICELEGPAGPELCEECARAGVDLVVIATHGRGAMGRLWLGSVADYVVRHLATPILLVHRERRGEGETPPDCALRSILVALDQSKDSEAILEPVTALAHITQGHITLIHILEPVYPLPIASLPYPITLDPAILERNEADAQHHLDRVADRLRERGLSVATRVSAEVSAAVGLLGALAEKRYDLIAMTTHGQGGMRRLLLGSVADKVIRGAEKPVLVVRPPVAVG